MLSLLDLICVIRTKKRSIVCTMSGGVVRFAAECSLFVAQKPLRLSHRCAAAVLALSYAGTQPNVWPRVSDNFRKRSFVVLR